LIMQQHIREPTTDTVRKSVCCIHIHTTDPHWIKNGDRVSISFSNGFKTRASLRRGWVYNVNGRMRKIGLDPVPYGKGALRDAMKLQAFRALCRAQRWLNIQPAGS